MEKIAIIGKPNVGKSSLFNRLVRSRDAIISDISGTTRDIKKSEVTINDKKATLIDTGGLDDSSTLFQVVRRQSIKAANDADVILYMIDGKLLPSDEDRKIFYELQKLTDKIALVINKIDNDREEEEIGWEFETFGAKNLFFLSVSHNRHTKTLTNWIDNQLAPLEESKEEIVTDVDDFSLEDFMENDEPKLSSLDHSNDEKKIAIIGRVNVGKSSLLNALLGKERSVVSSVAGTTVDPVDESIMRNGKKYTFIDTAGIRRRGKIVGIEKFALNRTRLQLEKADIVLLVLDSSEPYKDLDEKIANMVDKFALSVVVVLNKWDMCEDEYKVSVQKVRDRFKFLSYAPILTISALTSKRVHKVYDLIDKVYENYTRRIPTSKLNEIIKMANQRHHLPSEMGKIVKIYFSTQFDIKPPRIALIMNRPRSLHFSYKRYLVNQIRRVYDFEGTQIILEPKQKKSSENFDED
ncbi:MAG TPA: ribosome biogenesis GTPase Der [Campylobacterales bacterium]|nr:ribosome biogenesis GTPase Der [Campylobacterales bacterium]